MKESMKYNPCYYQIREFQLHRILSIIQQRKQTKTNGIVFFGDSIIEQWNLQENFPTIKNIINCGISGATAQELLWVIDETLIKYKPKTVVLHMGTNDLGDTSMESPRTIALHIKTIVEMIRGNLPDTEIIILSPLPCIEAKRDFCEPGGLRYNIVLEMIYQQCIQHINDDKTTFLSIFDEFIDDNYQAIEHFYLDGLHINTQAYQLISSMLLPMLEQGR